MKKLYIGLDTHKENIVIGLAFAGNAVPEVYGKVSADLDRFIAGLRKLLKKYDHLVRRGLPENKIKVAVARELLGFIWELGQVVKV